jgi:hypothetical protein
MGNAGIRSPRFWVKIYVAALLSLFLLGAAENIVDSEGMGFLPLIVLTTPWSWLLMPTWNLPMWGSGLLARELMVFLTCAFSGTANSYILFFLLRRREQKESG